MSGCLLSLGGEFYILRTRREEVEMNLDAEKRDGYYISMDMKKIWNVQLKLLKEFQIICKKITLYIMHVEEPYLELLDIGGIFHGMMI